MLATGSDDSDSSECHGEQTLGDAARDGETRPVEMVGEALPDVRRSVVDPAVGLASPVVTGEQFDGAADHHRRPDRRPDAAGVPRPLVSALQRRDPRADRTERRRRDPAELDVIGISTAVASDRPELSAVGMDRREGLAVADDGRRRAVRVRSSTSVAPAFPFLVMLDADGTVLARQSGESIVRADQGVDRRHPRHRLGRLILRRASCHRPGSRTDDAASQERRSAVDRSAAASARLMISATGRPSAVAARAASSNSTLTRWSAILTPIVWPSTSTLDIVSALRPADHRRGAHAERAGVLDEQRAQAAGIGRIAQHADGVRRPALLHHDRRDPRVVRAGRSSAATAKARTSPVASSTLTSSSTTGVPASSVAGPLGRRPSPTTTCTTLARSATSAVPAP